MKNETIDNLQTGRFHLLFIILFVTTFAAMLGMGIIEPILPLYAKSMGASGLAIGVIFAGFAISRGIFAPIFGTISDYRGRKKLILVGLGLYTIFSLAYAAASTPWMLLVIRLLQGVGSVMITPIAQSYVGDIVPRGQEGKYMNLFYISLFAGMAGGPAIGGVLADRLGIAWPFYAVAMISFLAALFVLAFVPESPMKNKKPSHGIRHSLMRVLRDNPMRGVLAFISSRGFYRWGFNTFFPVFAATMLAFSKTKIGLFLSAYMLAGAALQYPAGILADRFSAYKKHMVLAGGVLSAIPMFLIGFTKNIWAVLFLMIAMGVFSSFARASVVAVRTERGRIFGMGAVTGIFTSSLSLGQVFGPIVFGLLYDRFGLTASFILGGAIGLAGALAGFVFLDKSPTAEKISPAEA